MCLTTSSFFKFAFPTVFWVCLCMAKFHPQKFHPWVRRCSHHQPHSFATTWDGWRNDVEPGGQSMFWDGFQWVPRADTGAVPGGRKAWRGSEGCFTGSPQRVRLVGQG